MNAIQIESLRKHYNGVQALDGLNMEVKSNSVYGFLGPNGAGKTTTLRLIVNLAHPDEGRIWIDGKESTSGKKDLPHVGYLPEEPAFYPWMTPIEFLDFVGRIFHQGDKERKERINEMIEISGLKEARTRRIGGFSHGMRQRLGLAQALMNRPKVLLLDEPVSALDPAGRKEVLDLIGDLRKSCTILMSTHILADVERVCDTIGIINAGKMVVQSERSELLDRYAVSALEVELANGSSRAILDIQKIFEQIEGVDSVRQTENVLRITARDTGAVSLNLMQVITSHNIQVNRLEVVKPSLEDIFLQLTSEGKVQS